MIKSKLGFQIYLSVSSTTEMKLKGCVLLILIRTELVSTYSVDVLNYLLRTFEYLESVHAGVFRCVFWDITADETHEGIMNAVLQSDRLTGVTKYLVKGSYFEEMESLACNPSLLVIFPGEDVMYFDNEETKKNLSRMMRLFHQATKVLVLTDLENPQVAEIVGVQIYTVKFMYFVIMDSRTMRIVQCNGVWNWSWPRALQPMNLFTWDSHNMMGRRISYVQNEQMQAFYYNYHWLNETAKYLHTEAEEFPNDCHKLEGNSFTSCLEKHMFLEKSCDMIFVYIDSIWTHDRYFRLLYTSIPIFMEILVPRDRPCNALELLIMPFSWQVWAVLIVILIISEIAKLAFPEHLINNPTLLVVCGFERHNLHRSGRTEKFIFLSLIVLMFFMSNAFETKFVSLMISKPSIQRIKSIEDLAKSGLKFQVDLNNSPQLVSHPIIGKMVVHKSSEVQDEDPTIAQTMMSDVVRMRMDLTFNYNRLQSFYAKLNYRYFHGYEIYWTKDRFLFQDAFKYTHITLVEAGLMGLWKKQWRAQMRSKYVGRRPRKSISNKKNIEFEDMQPAWMALAVGLSTSMIVFLLEVLFKIRVF